MNDLRDFLAKRPQLFRNPTPEAAAAFMPAPPGGWAKPDTPLAALHRARTQWLDATDAMLAESTAWLKAHGYSAAWHGAAALTPASRDLLRMQRGKLPLAGTP